MAQDSTTKLRKLTEWRKEMTIVPFSGIQMLDFGFNLEGQRLRYDYAEVVLAGDQTGKADNGQLIPLTGDADKDSATLAGFPVEGRKDYTLNERQALAPYLSKWVPVPVLRLRKERGRNGEERFDPGPTTWARVRVAELDQPDPETGHSHRVQLALDTALVEANPQDSYLCPEQDDSRNAREFRLVSDPNALGWFLRRPVAAAQKGSPEVDVQKWVSDWTEALFRAFVEAARTNRPIAEDLAFEHWARYLAFLRLLDGLIEVPLLRLVNIISERDRGPFVDVDLVLDIGNSRTCGLLVEQIPADSGRANLTSSYPLAIRDLSRPEFYYEGLIASRVEFCELAFGEDRFSRLSGRSNAFLWPSIVRVGPEAIRLVQAEDGTENMSGLSSPKRYLWDSAAMSQDWRFHAHNDANSLPRGARAAMQLLNEAGDVLPQIEYEESPLRRLREKGKTSKIQAVRPRFSRSSLFCFMLAEIFSHAMVQINDPAQRANHAQSDMPRRLKRIILTLPTATPIQEQAIIRSRAESALLLIWERMLRSGNTTHLMAKPELKVEWDEASCTQVVFLYNEIVQKYGGRMEAYLKATGTERVQASQWTATPSLRVCSIDIGGGTTDMMVATYHCDDDRLLKPTQNFREGFRIAGDDILARVVSTVILRRLCKDAEDKGGTRVLAALAELFGGDVTGQDQRTIQMRRQFALRVLTPLAIAALERAETAGPGDDLVIAVADVIGTTAAAPVKSAAGKPAEPERLKLDLPAALVDYLELPMRKRGALDWRLVDVVLQVPRADIDIAIRETMQGALDNMVEVINHLGCDVVLLTGRPSRLPALRAIIENACVVRPDKLLSMHAYRTELWYPYRNRVTQRIDDPKTTVVVGGMLLALAENRILNLAIATEAFQMKSTVRYIGEMEENGQISENRVLFNVDNGPNETAEFTMHRPIHIGSRQLPLPRWTTTPLYRLEFTSPPAMRGRTPLKILLARSEFDDAPEGAEAILRSESLKEGFKIIDAYDSSGSRVKVDSELTLRLHTLGFDDQYWLDTGIFLLT